MQSNRADFLEMREHDAIENPQDYERPEEKKPMCIDDWLADYVDSERKKYKEEFGDLPYRLNLEARSRDYIAAINAKEGPRSKADHSDIDFDAKFIGPKMLTAVQKLHFIPESQENPGRIKEMQDAVKNLKSININKYCHGHS